MSGAFLVKASNGVLSNSYTWQSILNVDCVEDCVGPVFWCDVSCVEDESHHVTKCFVRTHIYTILSWGIIACHLESELFIMRLWLKDWRRCKFTALTHPHCPVFIGIFGLLNICCAIFTGGALKVVNNIKVYWVTLSTMMIHEFSPSIIMIVGLSSCLVS